MVAYSDDYYTPFETPITVPAPGFLSNDTLECQPYDIVITSAPADGTLVDNGGGGFEYSPDAGFSGLDAFSYELHDANQQVLANSVVDIFVSPPPCIAVDDAYSTPIDQTLTVAAPGVLGNDTLCPDLWFVSLDASPANGSVNFAADGSFEYVPDSGYTGPDTFTYELNGIFDVLATATVTIDVGSPIESTTSAPSTTSSSSSTTSTTSTTAPPIGSTTSTTSTTAPPIGSTTTAAAGSTTAPAVGTTTPSGTDGPATPPASTEAPPAGFRVATFDASLSRATAGELIADLSSPDDPQAAAVAEIIQRTRPDMLLLTGFDHDENGAAVDLFRGNYLEVSQHGAESIDYPYVFSAPVNAGTPSGFDLDNNGAVGGPHDALGLGAFPGQSGMVVLSRFPIVTDEVRTFQRLLWSALPGARLPDDPATPDPADWYSADELGGLPLSSASHWDVPVDVDGRIIHLLAANPSAATLDGPEDRNGARNADEIGFWADYVAGADTSWIVDDAGTSGGLDAGAEFVILGAMNSDPLDGDGAGGISQLLALDGVEDPSPASAGAVEASAAQGLANTTQQGDPANDTADFPDHPGPGNLRVDYVLPASGLAVVDAGVFWPTTGDPQANLVAGVPASSSDHRLVWVDVA
jgi:hypothetical protein